MAQKITSTTLASHLPKQVNTKNAAELLYSEAVCCLAKANLMAYSQDIDPQITKAVNLTAWVENGKVRANLASGDLDHQLGYQANLVQRLLGPPSSADHSKLLESWNRLIFFNLSQVAGKIMGKSLLDKSAS